MIEFKNVFKSFGSQQVLADFSLRVEKGEVLLIIGASGVGKSVTIKHLIGLLQPDEGEIFLDGNRIDHQRERDYYDIRRRCAMVFQSSTLFDSLTVLENVLLPLRKHRSLGRKERELEARRLLSLVQMESFAEAYPAELGDGPRKRVAIARALTLQPEYILFDEPTTGLDPISARRVDNLINKLKQLGVTSVVVSHDLTSIFNIADRIAFIYQKRVHLLATPEEFRQSSDPIIQQFITGASVGPMETPGF